jgi:hypothetical protein
MESFNNRMAKKNTSQAKKNAEENHPKRDIGKSTENGAWLDQ